jgi:hypothetical protein
LLRWLQRVVPPEFNANFHPDSHTSNGVSDNANVVENEVISDFSAFVRNKFGDKVCVLLFIPQF